MTSVSDWKISPSAQPKPEDYGYDLDRALSSVVGVRSDVPADAFTAETLGTERAGNGVVIRENGLVLTIGYLITEAESVWLHLADGHAVPGHVLAYDQVTGFGLVQALAHIDVPALPLGDSSAKQEFAGYWEYVLDEAIFTAPAHPNWGGAALIGPAGDLLGIGSLQVEREREKGLSENLNMVVPIDLLKPILDDLATRGQANRPPRPWLGIYAAEVEDRIVVVGTSERGPVKRADLRTGDIVLAVGGARVNSLADLFRRIWSLGPAGVEVPLSIYREGRTFEVRVTSADRSKFLKAPRLH
jgi:S1-C subfamily serine protease